MKLLPEVRARGYGSHAPDPLRQGSPGLAEQDAQGDEHRAESHEQHADFHDLRLRDQIRRQVREDLLELVRARRRVVLAAGRLGDGQERLLIDR